MAIKIVNYKSGAARGRGVKREKRKGWKVKRTIRVGRYKFKVVFAR